MDTEVIFYLRWFAPYRLNHVSYVDWAIKQIENGYNLEEIYELAGLYRNVEYSNLEIEKYFIACIKGLEISEPETESEVLINYSICMCKAIIEKCNSRESLEHIVGELTSNIEDFNIDILEPLMKLSVDLFNIKHGIKPEYYIEISNENSIEFAKALALIFIKENA
ncbi:MAG TPA: hypothetical protein VL995_11835 [Cellvibrio sp.]|nr:hypothetical protein [Cellvibrio sp.]